MLVKNNLGFTLLELLIVIVIIVGIAAMVIPMIGGVSEKSRVTITLNEMKNIKEAIRDRFYLDLGLIPEDSNNNTQYATRYLCLVHDPDPDCNITDAGCCTTGSSDCIEMCEFLWNQIGNSTKVGKLLHWNRWTEKGWRGPYMEPDVRDNDTDYPLIADAWGNYYHILGEQNNTTQAYIVSCGKDGNYDNGTNDDIKMWIFGANATQVPE